MVNSPVRTFRQGLRAHKRTNHQPQRVAVVSRATTRAWIPFGACSAQRGGRPPARPPDSSPQWTVRRCAISAPKWAIAATSRVKGTWVFPHAGPAPRAPTRCPSTQRPRTSCPRRRIGGRVPEPPAPSPCSPSSSPSLDRRAHPAIMRPAAPGRGAGSGSAALETGLHESAAKEAGGSGADASPSGEVALSPNGPGPGSPEEIAFSPPGQTWRHLGPPSRL